MNPLDPIQLRYYGFYIHYGSCGPSLVSLAGRHHHDQAQLPFLIPASVCECGVTCYSCCLEGPYSSFTERALFMITSSRTNLLILAPFIGAYQLAFGGEVTRLTGIVEDYSGGGVFGLQLQQLINQSWGCETNTQPIRLEFRRRNPLKMQVRVL